MWQKFLLIWRPLIWIIHVNYSFFAFAVRVQWNYSWTTIYILQAQFLHRILLLLMPTEFLFQLKLHCTFSCQVIRPLQSENSCGKKKGCFSSHRKYFRTTWVEDPAVLMMLFVLCLMRHTKHLEIIHIVRFVWGGRGITPPHPLVSMTFRPKS